MPCKIACVHNKFCRIMLKCGYVHVCVCVIKVGYYNYLDAFIASFKGIFDLGEYTVNRLQKYFHTHLHQSNMQRMWRV